MKLNIKRTIDKTKSTRQIIDFLLKDRKIKNEQEFIKPKHPKDINFSEFFKGKKNFQTSWKKITQLLEKIYENKEMVVVYTDYDADGITGGAILWEVLHLLGFRVMPHVPDRKKEGYGFSKQGIDLVKKKYNPSLIISVDHGIVAEKEILYAKKLGIKTIVTDHHQKEKSRPKSAFAVFHTDELSGSGVSYFFSKDIFKHFSKRSGNNQLETNFLGDYLTLASIGAVADLVPLIGLNRSIVSHGLKAFKTSSRIGIKHILRQAGIENRPISTYEIGFIIAPRINAFGRLTHGIDALRLLCTTKKSRAADLALRADSTNRQRQDLVKKAVEDAEKKVNTKHNLIVIKSSTWEEGIIGLIAAKLCEKYYRPVVVMTKSDGYYKASVRSIKDFDVISFLRLFRSLLVDVGGHRAAAGFTIKKENVEQFTKKAQAKADKLITKGMLISSTNVDMGIPLITATLGLAGGLEKLKPFGMGNPTPLFYSEGTVKQSKLVGKNSDHLQIIISANSHELECIYFGGGEKFYSLSRGDRVSIIYNLVVDRWNRRVRVKGMVKEIASI